MLSRIGLHQPAGGFDAIDGGHRDVHQHDVGSELEREAHALVAVAGLSDHLDAFRFEPAPQPLAQHRVIVDEQCRQAHARAPFGWRSPTRITVPVGDESVVN